MAALQGEGTHVRPILPSLSDIVPRSPNSQRVEFRAVSGFFVNSSTARAEACGELVLLL